MSKFSELIETVVEKADDKRLPAYEVRIVEINDGTPWVEGKPPETDYKRHRVSRNQLRTPTEYESRFDELLHMGYSWLNVELWGVYRNFLIVAVVVPSRKLASGDERKLHSGCATSINMSGPCNAVKSRDLNVEWQLEIVE